MQKIIQFEWSLHSNAGTVEWEVNKRAGWRQWTEDLFPCNRRVSKYPLNWANPKWRSWIQDVIFGCYTYTLLYLSSVKVCHVAGRRDAGSESLWLKYDPPMCCISGAIFPLNEFTVVHDTASTGKAFQLLTTLWLKEYLRQSRRAPFLWIFNVWPLVLFSTSISKKSSLFSPSNPFIILNTSMISALVLLASSVTRLYIMCS